jgi:methylated-DNA-[protein]-cysteine S-methyltransferase
VSYGALAARIAEARGLARFSAQAVGGAVGRNPISLLIPCHRVLGADGSLTGYAGGLERKAALLRLEGVPLP